MSMHIFVKHAGGVKPGIFVGEIELGPYGYTMRYPADLKTPLANGKEKAKRYLIGPSV